MKRPLSQTRTRKRQELARHEDKNESWELSMELTMSDWTRKTDEASSCQMQSQVKVEVHVALRDVELVFDNSRLGSDCRLFRNPDQEMTKTHEKMEDANYDRRLNVQDFVVDSALDKTLQLLDHKDMGLNYTEMILKTMKKKKKMMMMMMMEAPYLMKRNQQDMSYCKKREHLE